MAPRKQELELPRCPEPADEADVWIEQVEFLIDHAFACEDRTTKCRECRRVRLLRQVLMAPFNPKRNTT